MMLEARAAAVNIPEAAETAAEEGMDINMEEVRQGGATRQQDLILQTLLQPIAAT